MTIPILFVLYHLVLPENFLENMIRLEKDLYEVVGYELDIFLWQELIR